MKWNLKCYTYFVCLFQKGNSLITLDNKAIVPDDCRMNRRKFLGIGLTAAAAALVPGRILAAVKESLPPFFNDYQIVPEKKISLYNVYSHEKLKTVFWQDLKDVIRA